MATKENKRQIRELMEGLEQRIHCGPAIQRAEIHSARDLLRRHDFSPASDYFNRLAHLENRLQERTRTVAQPQTKRNYGGKAAGYQMQVQSIHDHLILSTCYDGDFNTRHGRVKISHRFNQEGRIDFVELKYLNSLHPPLNGELRKLLTVKDYPSIRKDWYEAEAHVLRVLPQELIFLYEDIFQCPRPELLAWLVNIGHGLVADLLRDLKSRKHNGSRLNLAGPTAAEPNLCWPNGGGHKNGDGSVSQNGNGRAVCLVHESNGHGRMAQNGNGLNGSRLRTTGYPEQLQLDALPQDEVAMPILEKVAGLESVVEIDHSDEVLVRYSRKNPC
jgi:hypothetical protein